MKLKTTPFDAAEYLETAEDIAAYLEAAFDDGDPAEIADALGVVARAKGMTEIAAEAGVTRASLYKSLAADGNAEFSTILRVIKAFGLQLKVAPVAGPAS